MSTLSQFAVIVPLALAFFVLLDLFTKSPGTHIHPAYRHGHPTAETDPRKYYEMVLSENQDKYYLQRFLSFDGALSGMGFSWNWPAALFSVYWLLYRGMKLTSVLIIVILLASAVLAPIKFTLSLWVMVMLVLGASATRYFHYLLKQDIQKLLDQNLGDDAMRNTLSGRWHSRFTHFDLGMIALFLGLGVLVYFYEFKSDDISIDIIYPPSQGPYPPDPGLGAMPGSEDLKTLLQRKVHRDSFAYLFLERLNAEKAPDRQRVYAFIIDAAAGQDNAQAQYLKGRMHLTGYPDTPKNTRVAMTLLGKSASHGYTDAQLELGKLAYSRRIAPPERAEAKAYLAQAADQGSTDAKDLVRQLGVFPPGVGPRDKGLANLMALAGQGDLEAKNTLLDKVRTEQSKNSQNDLVQDLLNGSSLDNPIAQHALGLAYQNGYLGLPKNASLAAAWYRQGADKGLTDSIIELGKLYHTDEQRNPGEAAYWLARANAPGQGPVRNLFKPLDGSESSARPRTSTVDMLLIQAKAGNRSSLDTLMDTVFHEQASNRQKSLLIELLGAAASNNAVAQYALGLAYQNGHLGLDRDLHTALIWYQQAAANGYVDSQLALGRLYGSTPEEPAHLVKARYWLGKAAKAGSPEARGLLKQYQTQGSARH